MRYQFYREHKYVSSALNDLERLIAKSDFRDFDEIMSVQKAFQSLAEMLKGHAQYENERLHRLLKNRDSTIYKHAEEDHDLQDEQLHNIQEMIKAIINESSADEKISLGYQLYLTYRKFVADNLAHLHEEETLILPELQRLYTDEELKEVEAETYRIMTPEQLIEMCQVLFPHMNASDKLAFLEDIQAATPEKYRVIHQTIAPLLPKTLK